jgi:hypothetical protein
VQSPGLYPQHHTHKVVCLVVYMLPISVLYNRLYKAPACPFFPISSHEPCHLEGSSYSLSHAALLPLEEVKDSYRTLENGERQQVGHSRSLKRELLLGRGPECAKSKQSLSFRETSLCYQGKGGCQATNGGKRN